MRILPLRSLSAFASLLALGCNPIKSKDFVVQGDRQGVSVSQSHTTLEVPGYSDEFAYKIKLCRVEDSATCFEDFTTAKTKAFAGLPEGEYRAEFTACDLNGEHCDGSATFITFTQSEIPEDERRKAALLAVESRQIVNSGYRLFLASQTFGDSLRTCQATTQSADAEFSEIVEATIRGVTSATQFGGIAFAEDVAAGAADKSATESPEPIAQQLSLNDDPVPVTLYLWYKPKHIFHDGHFSIEGFKYFFLGKRYGHSAYLVGSVDEVTGVLSPGSTYLSFPFGNDFKADMEGYHGKFDKVSLPSITKTQARISSEWQFYSIYAGSKRLESEREGLDKIIRDAEQKYGLKETVLEQLTRQFSSLAQTKNLSNAITKAFEEAGKPKPKSREIDKVIEVLSEYQLSIKRLDRWQNLDVNTEFAKLVAVKDKIRSAGGFGSEVLLEDILFSGKGFPRMYRELPEERRKAISESKFTDLMVEAYLLSTDITAHQGLKWRFSFGKNNCSDATCHGMQVTFGEVLGRVDSLLPADPLDNLLKARDFAERMARLGRTALESAVDHSIWFKERGIVRGEISSKLIANLVPFLAPRALMAKQDLEGKLTNRVDTKAPEIARSNQQTLGSRSAPVGRSGPTRFARELGDTRHRPTYLVGQTLRECVAAASEILSDEVAPLAAEIQVAQENAATWRLVL